ncbi:MAG: nucleoside hydrolase [Gemmobacter sp.]
MQPIRAVIDTDPGLDDAVAILFALASPAFEVLGITTVAGNIGLGTVTRNAGRLLAVAGRADVPVIAGAAGPLVRKGFDSSEIHGADGLGGVALPEPLAEAQAGAVDWLAALLAAEPAGTVDLLTLGPLTNLARLVTDHPAAARRIRRVIAMGGAVNDRGNVGPRAEFNIAADPEAADIVLGAGLPMTLIPLDVTRQVRADAAWCGRLRASGRPGAAACAALVEAYFASTTVTGALAESRPLHDPCVMLLAEAPGFFGCDAMGLAVDLGEAPDAGALNPDTRRPAVQVAQRVDAAGALALLAGRLTA